MKTLMRVMCVMVALLAAGAAVEAQTVVNPRAVRFESPDHAGDPLRRPATYIVDFFVVGAAEPMQSPSVAASAVTPVPSTSPQQYEVTFAQLGGYPAGTTFAAKVRATNPAGSSAASNASDPFGDRVPPATPTSVAVVP